MTEPNVTATDLTVALDGHRLHARRWLPAGAGDGTTLILIHDSLGCVGLWRDFPERLAAATGLPVVAYDRLGFGRSDPHPGLLPRDFVAAEGGGALAALRQQAGIGRYALFGHSVGGGMAIVAAAQDPGACLGVITAAAQAFAEPQTLDGVRQARIHFADPGQRARLARHHGAKTDWVLAAWIETWLDPHFADWTLDPFLAGLRCPILAIHGDSDEYGTPAHPARIAARAGGPARTVVLEGCGHFPHRERTDRVLAETAAFLADLPRGA